MPTKPTRTNINTRGVSTIQLITVVIQETEPVTSSEMMEMKPVIPAPVVILIPPFYGLKNLNKKVMIMATNAIPNKYSIATQESH